MARPKPGKQGRKPKGRLISKSIAGMSAILSDDDIDTFHKQREKIPLDFNDDFEKSEEEMEEPVLNLKAESSDDSEDMENGDDTSDEEQLSGLAAKMAKQAKNLRQRTSLMEDEDDEEGDNTEKERAAWGKWKKMYYSADNVDFELQSSDEEAPAEEEAEVLRLQRLKAESLQPEDFELDDEEDIAEPPLDEQEQTLQEVVQRTEQKAEKRELQNVLKGHAGRFSGERESMSIEEVKKDLNALSKEEKMEIVMSDAPELVGLLTELREGVNEIQNKVEPLLKKVKCGHYATKDGISYLETKHMLLLCYCQSILFYLLLKAEGRSVRDHPVIARLVELRMFLEKIQPIDKNLQYQIEKLLQLEEGPSIAVNKEDSPIYAPVKDDQLNYRPNSDMLVSKIDQDAPVQEVVGLESKEMLQERARLEEHTQQKEGLFMRVPLSKSEMQKLKHLKRSRNGLMGMLDDLDDDVADAMWMEEDKPAQSEILKPRKLSQLIAEAGKKSKKPKIISGDADLPAREDIGERRVRREIQKASKLNRHEEEEDAEESEGIQLEEDEFYQEAKQLKAAKQALKATKYSRTAIIPAEEAAAEGKRHISYQMEKNKGLTPHRKKLTKNPRKKYKVKHQKAIIRRKGQVREVKLPTGQYGGEATGIRTNISRSVRFQN